MCVTWDILMLFVQRYHEGNFLGVCLKRTIISTKFYEEQSVILPYQKRPRLPTLRGSPIAQDRSMITGQHNIAIVRVFNFMLQVE